MGGIFKSARGAVDATVAILATLALAACVVAPGRFQSTLELRRDGQFTYSYRGQIYLLALSRLAELASKADAGAEAFDAQPCYDFDSFEERPCTEDELAEQRAEWEEQAAERQASAERDSAAIQALLGGIDPADPQAAEELAERLRRQKGWSRVDYRGDGLFEVEFSLTSHIGHDFSFPTFERLPISNSFVVANLRQGATVRIEAPGFAAQGAGGNPLQGMMTGMAGVFEAADSQEAAAETPGLPEIDGTFRIVTDGRILSNNTDEGPAEVAGGQMLEWKITPRTRAAPMALIQLD